jgi:DNA replication protein DnaC
MYKLYQLNKKTPEQIALIKKFLGNPKGFLLLKGNNGTGKSFIAEGIYEFQTPYKLPYYNGDLAIFISQAELNEKWLHAKHENSSYDLLQRLKETKFLVLDDLGTRKPSEAFNDFIHSIVDYRWRFRETLGTVITTNRTTKEISEDFSTAIQSRIYSGIVISFDSEEDRRHDHHFVN